MVCEAGDIGLRAVRRKAFREAGREAEEEALKEAETEEILPITRLGHTREIHTGHCNCSQGERLESSLDNTFSLLRSKTVQYRLVVDLMDSSDYSISEQGVIRTLRTGNSFISTEEEPQIVITKF